MAILIDYEVTWSVSWLLQLVFMSHVIQNFSSKFLFFSCAVCVLASIAKVDQRRED